jgi:lipid-A-disaccharide synthase
LVNLIAGREVVAELVADGMTVENVKQQLEAILPGQMTREKMLQDYDALIKILGQEGASERAAGKIVEFLSQKYNRSLQ